jgi:hypothetical protein
MIEVRGIMGYYNADDPESQRCYRTPKINAGTWLTTRAAEFGSSFGKLLSR